jgi:molecular chaperone GrpE (heat shock protein)
MENVEEIEDEIKELNKKFRDLKDKIHDLKDEVFDLKDKLEESEAEFEKLEKDTRNEKSNLIKDFCYFIEELGFDPLKFKLASDYRDLNLILEYKQQLKKLNQTKE